MNFFRNQTIIIMKNVTKFILMLFVAAIAFSGCDNDEDDNVNNSEQWDLTASIDLGGEFSVVATAEIAISGSTFTATVETSQIAGQPEVHTATISGTVQNETTLVVTNQTFNITVGTDTHTVTLNGSITVSGDSLSGSGTITENIPGVGDVNGTFAVTGTK